MRPGSVHRTAPSPTTQCVGGCRPPPARNFRTPSESCPSECPRSARCFRRLPRSEEHTSELQSPCNLVCRLLLEKKKSTSLSCASTSFSLAKTTTSTLFSLPTEPRHPCTTPAPQNETAYCASNKIHFQFILEVSC